MDVVTIKPGLLIGSAPVAPKFVETRVDLKPGETLILYTDGYLEGTAPDGRTEFGVERLKEAVGGPRSALPLEQCMVQTSAAVRRFTCKDELEDDQTMLLLRRREAK